MVLSIIFLFSSSSSFFFSFFLLLLLLLLLLAVLEELRELLAPTGDGDPAGIQALKADFFEALAKLRANNHNLPLGDTANT